MSYRGHVENGVVVFDQRAPWPDGTQVEVELAPEPPRRTLAERLRGVIGIAKGLPPDLAENHDHYLHGRPKH
ncbi:MAG: hypothetical protein FJ290_22655 [Planctomycetes bacterium]|nr:hypothetical protein [Planctomycetota bacterium]